MPDQGQQSSLRQAVDRILGFQPGGQQQQSDFQLAAKPMMSDVGGVGNLDWSKSLGTSSAVSNPASVAPAAPVYSMYDSVNLRPDGSLAVGNASNTKTPWIIATQQNLSDPEIRAAMQRNRDSSQSIVDNLSSLNVPGTANYNNPNLAINQKRVSAIDAMLKPTI